MRRAPLLLVGDPSLISSGLAPDRHSIMQPLWEAAANVRFYQGKVRRLVPPALMREILSSDGFITKGLHQQQTSNGIRYVFIVPHRISNSEQFLYRTDFANNTAISTSIGNSILYGDEAEPATFIDFHTWGNWTLLTLNRIPYRWDNTAATITPIPNAPQNILGLMKVRNQLMAIGVGDQRKAVHWSHADNIELWAAAADNLAGSLTIEELETRIRAYSKLGRSIAVYAEDQLALVNWIGAPYYFGQQLALDGIGAVGKRSVCADGRLNYGFGRNGCWQTDGNDFRYIDHGIIGDYLQDNVTWAQAGMTQVFRNDVTRCIEFHFPVRGSQRVNEAWSYDPQTGSWAPVVAYDMLDERKLFRKPLAGAGGRILLLDDDPATTSALTLRSKPLTIDAEGIPGLHLDARIDEVEIAAKAAVGVDFRISNATDIDGPWEYSSWHTISPDMRTYRIGQMPTGTFHRLELRNTLTNWQLDLQGFAFYGFIEGVKRDTI